MKTVTERGTPKGGYELKACPVADNDPIVIKNLIWVVWMFSRKLKFLLEVGDPGGGSLENQTNRGASSKACPGRRIAPIILILFFSESS